MDLRNRGEWWTFLKGADWHRVKNLKVLGTVMGGKPFPAGANR